MHLKEGDHNQNYNDVNNVEFTHNECYGTRADISDICMSRNEYCDEVLQNNATVYEEICTIP